MNYLMRTFNVSKLFISPHVQHKYFKINYGSSTTTPDFSKNKYNVQRSNFNTLQENHLLYFKSIMDKERVITDQSDVLPYNIDWIKNCRGESRVVLKPKTTEEVSKILSFCNDNNLAVCPQGGNTGLVGGSVPVFDEVIISTVLMNKIISLDEFSGVLVCESGCVLENLDTHAREHNLIMPLDLGAKGSCHIGGNISTNAGGLRLLRFGNLHGSVLGVEAVKANGEVLDLLRTLKKDNTGYHLKHMFIGSEGTLGIVTKVSIHCPSLSSSVNVGFFGVKDFESVLKVYKRAKSSLGEILSAYEMADAGALESSMSMHKLQNPIGDHPFYVLIETSGSNESHDSEKLSKFLEETMETGLVEDGTLCSEPSRIKNLWALREGMAGSLLNYYVLKYDISLPLLQYYKIVPEVRKYFGNEVFKVIGYGHIGDGNLHLNIALKEFCPDLVNRINTFVYDYVHNLHGSISAEHGIGFLKTKYMGIYKDQSSLKLMKEMKTLMDPKGILNPYKVLP